MMLPKRIGLLFILSLSSVSVLAQSVMPGDEQECRQLVGEAKSAFMGLLAESQREASTVTREDLKAASREYVSISSQCFELIHGYSSYAGMPIDVDPELPPISDGGGTAPMNGVTPQFITIGTKWGAGSPFHTPGPGFDVRGPGLPGGEVTYSFMASGVSMSGDTGANSNNAEILDTYVCFDDTDNGRLRKEIKSAFAAWELVADITFREVADSGHAFNASGASGDIRIGFHGFSSPTTLAHAYHPPLDGEETIASGSKWGDIHFNSGVYWECDPGQDVVVADDPVGVDLGIIALHEIGHAIGKMHEGGAADVGVDPNPEYALMNALYDPSIGMPLADDIEGAESIYGSPQLDRTFWGRVGIGTESPDTALHVAGTNPEFTVA